MTPTYKYFVDDAVLEVFGSCTITQRQNLLQIFDRLAADPFQTGDSIQFDDSGRPCQVKRFGDWILTYWVELPISRVYILSADSFRHRV